MLKLKGFFSAAVLRMCRKTTRTLNITHGDESSARSGTYPLYKQAEVVAVLSRRCFSVELFASCLWKSILCDFFTYPRLRKVSDP
jgi:hypothetical protein